MAKLIYSAIMSLDGYIEDQNGKFDWAVPGEEVHRFVNGLERAAGTYPYGRRMYETMALGRLIPASRLSRPSRWTSPRSGRPPTRSCTPGRWRRPPQPRRGSRDFVPRSPRRKSRTASASVFRIDSITVHVTFEEGTQAAWLYEIVRPVVAEVMVCNPRRNKLLAVGDAGELTGSWKLRRHSQGFRQQSAVLMAHSAPRL
jgi:hypothetical protein